MKKLDIDFIFQNLNELFPNADTELKFSTDFQLLVAVIMSAQSTDKQVNKITDNLFKVVKNPQDVIDMGLEKFTKAISSINYYKNKSKYIFETSKILKNNPELLCSDLNQLQKLPGVGMKTAKVLSYELFGANVIAVDTHVHRVANRLGFVSTKDPEKTSEALEKIIPHKYKRIAHHTLVLFGRYYCTAKNPKCEDCCLSQICKYKNFIK